MSDQGKNATTEHTLAWFYEPAPRERTWSMCYCAGITADLEKRPRIPPAYYNQDEQGAWLAGYDR